MLPIEQDKRLIAFVSNSAWSVYNFRIDVIRHLIGKGFKILVVAPIDENSTLLQDEGCIYADINFNNRHENPLQDVTLYSQLKSIYKKFHPDFIFHYMIMLTYIDSLLTSNLYFYF